MKIGVLGTGVVGHAIATRLVELGHEVTMGSRRAGNEKAAAWAEASGERAHEGSFADAAAFGELLVNCTAGTHSLAALGEAGVANLAATILIDIANPLDFSGGMPPTLAVCNTDSLGEQIQSTFPDTKVVKALNTMNCQVMVDPGRVSGEHVAFVCGDDADAKALALELAAKLVAGRALDAGPLASARTLEGMTAVIVNLNRRYRAHAGIAATGIPGA